ncbi:MAG: hypothetical protein NVS9B2_30370 [Steroidobacteraceae bacterium]
MNDRRGDPDEALGAPRGKLARRGRLLGPGRYRSPAKTPREKLARALRIAQRRPQALLKITRYGHGGFKILAHAKYISRHGKLTLEDEAGDRIDDPVALRRRVRAWIETAGAAMDEPAAEVKRKRRVTAHFVLDAGPGADPKKLTKATREFLAEQFGKQGHEYVFVRHDDTKQPHVHVILNLMDEHGKRLHTSVAEVQRWRERFAETARKHGIEVDASRAWERGKAARRSRGPMREGQTRQVPWTREQVRRGMDARRRKLLSQAMAAQDRGDGETAIALRDKAAAVGVQVSRPATKRQAERQPAWGDGGSGWATPARRNSQQVAREFLAHAETIEARERTSKDARQRESLRRAAAILREFADAIGPSSTPVRRLNIRNSRGPRRGFEAEIDD